MVRRKGDPQEVRKEGHRLVTRALLLFSALLCWSGCASDYVHRTSLARRSYETGNYDQALLGFEKELKDGSQNDRLLALLDKGAVLHAAGRWEESAAVFAEADRLSSQLDYASISEEAAVLLSNERRRAYRGEDFEKLMISVFQALNFAELGKDDDALVEVRRVDERIRKMITEEKKPYEQLAIARYLGGALYEDQRAYDDAFIDYQQALKLQPSLHLLDEPLVRLARKTGREEELRELTSRHPELTGADLPPDFGQLLVLIEAGKVPEKVESYRRPYVTGRYQRGGGELIQVPVFRDRWSPVQTIVQVEGQSQAATMVTSLSQVAKLHLNDRVGRMVMKQLAGVAVKAGIASGVGAVTRSRELGLLTFFLLSLTNQVDLRSWLSLPADFQLARFALPAGDHAVDVKGLSQSINKKVTIRAGRITFLVVRAF